MVCGAVARSFNSGGAVGGRFRNQLSRHERRVQLWPKNKPVDLSPFGERRP
jgi:hypothetical protein